MRIGIIGGGAAGIFSAIHLKRYNPALKVTILEKQERVGKKILSTGNGKCNITNINASESDYNTSKVSYALNKFKVLETIDYFKELGLLIKADNEGRCYPYSEKATTVVDVLVDNLNKLGVNVITGFDVVNIKANDEFMVYSKDYGLKHFDYLILATGGNSGITFQNESYKFIKQLGHTITNISPVLVALKTKENLKKLSGIRSKAKVKLFRNNKVIYETIGEVLYKDDGLSGIAIMEVSRFSEISDIISLDLVYDLNDFQLEEFLKDETNLYGLLPKMVANEVKNRAGNLVFNLRNFSFKVKDSYGYMNSQVTKGGVSIDEINPLTFESLKVANLYIVGEVLDVDGNCGGYNLQFAWSSGFSAAVDILNKEEGKNGK